MRRAAPSLLLSIFLLLLASSDGAISQQRAVRVQGRQPAVVGQRVALVIGNASYKNIGALRNPVNDAQDMAAALRSSGFKVTLLLDARRREINQAIRGLEDALRKGGVGLFYFAGHGVQVGGVNYLIPIGAEITREYEVQDEAVSANRVLGMMESAGNPLNMVFLDACRNNPYKGTFRSGVRGLAAVLRAPKGSFISYATGAGDVAADGTGRNGIYTRNLLRFMKVPGLEVTQLMKRVRQGVQRDTGGKQTPYELSSLTGDFYFTGAPPRKAPPTVAKTTPPPHRTINAEEALWKTIEDSKEMEDFQDYLGAYPNGRFAVIARIKIRRLKRAANPPPKVASKTAPRQKQTTLVQRPTPFSRPLNQITGRLLRTLKGHSSSVWGVAFSPDGRLALSGSANKKVKVWNVAAGRLLRTLKGHSSIVWSVAFSSDGRLALSGSHDKTLKLWEVTTGRLLRTIKGHDGPVDAVAFSPDQKLALSGSFDKTLRLWDVASWRHLRTLKGHSGWVRSAEFSPDGRLVLSGSYDNTLRIWEVATGRHLRTLKGHSNYVESVAFSPDGRLALSGSNDKTLRVWEVASGRHLRTFTGHSGNVEGVAFSPDGRLALSGSDDKTLRVWEVSTGRQLRTLNGHSGSVYSVTFSPDGRLALSGSADKTVKVWEIFPE